MPNEQISNGSLCEKLRHTCARISPKSCAESSIKSSRRNDFSSSATSVLQFPDGIMDTDMLSFSARLKTICVANRVHKVLSLGNGMPVKPSKTDDFPLD